MNTAKELTDQLITRAMNMKDFVVLRDFDRLPAGVVRYNIQHTTGQPARIFVPALTQQEAEKMVDDWFADDRHLDDWFGENE
jgi:hypothetical protein